MSETPTSSQYEMWINELRFPQDDSRTQEILNQLSYHVCRQDSIKDDPVLLNLTNLFGNVHAKGVRNIRKCSEALGDKVPHRYFEIPVKGSDEPQKVCFIKTSHKDRAKEVLVKANLLRGTLA